MHTGLEPAWHRERDRYCEVNWDSPGWASFCKGCCGASRGEGVCRVLQEGGDPTETLLWRVCAASPCATLSPLWHCLLSLSKCDVMVQGEVGV